MNKPSQRELIALRQRYAPVAPKKPIVWQVVLCKQVVYENSIQLCWHYIRTNNLNTKPIIKR